MSVSDEWTYWHLTPRGWERGSEKVDFQGTTERPTPPDAVLTTCFSDHQSSIYSKPHRELTETWRSDDAAAVVELLAKFGPSPNQL